MKKYLFFTAVATTLLLTISCSKKSDNSSDSITPSYSTETSDQTKTTLTKTTDSLLNELTTVSSLEAISNIRNYTYFSNKLNPFPLLTKKISFLTTLQAIGQLGRNGVGNLSVFDSLATCSAESLPTLQNEFESIKGIHAWNDAFKRWDWMDKKLNTIEISYPSTETGKTDDVNLFFSLTTSSIANYTSSGVPATLKIVVCKDKDTVATYNMAATYNSDGVPLSAKTSLTIGVYKFEANYSNTTTYNSIIYSLLKGSSALLRYYANISSTIDANSIANYKTTDQAANLVTDANTYFQICNIRLTGKEDFKSFYTENTKILSSADQDSVKVRQTADAVNEYSALLLIYANNNTITAQVKAYCEKTQDPYNPSLNLQFTFNDGTLYSGTYFGNEFGCMSSYAQNLYDKLKLL